MQTTINRSKGQQTSREAASTLERFKLRIPTLNIPS